MYAPTYSCRIKPDFYENYGIGILNLVNYYCACFLYYILTIFVCSMAIPLQTRTYFFHVLSMSMHWVLTNANNMASKLLKYL